MKAKDFRLGGYETIGNVSIVYEGGCYHVRGFDKENQHINKGMTTIREARRLARKARKQKLTKLERY